MKPPAPLPSLRRGLGALFILGAAGHAALMVFALLYAYGRLTGVYLGVESWHRLYRGHSILLVVALAAYLFLRSRREDILWVQPVVDAVFGLVLLRASFWMVSRAIFWGWIPPWVSVAPALALGVYGLRLFRGKQAGMLEMRL